MKLEFYVNYRGTCEEAFRFYEQHLGGRIIGISHHRDMPNPNLPEEWQDKVVHAQIEIAGSVLMGADIPNADPMRSASQRDCHAPPVPGPRSSTTNSFPASSPSR